MRFNMKIINPDLLVFIRSLPQCEFCGRRVRTGFEACHVLTRGRGGEKQLDVPFGVGAGCPPFSGNGCHRRSHDTGEGVQEFVANVAKRCKIAPEIMMDALKFLAWVPERPIAGAVAKRFEEISFGVRELVLPYMGHKL